MKLESMSCPFCSAPLSLHPSSQYCRCEHCGREFIVNWHDSETAVLTAWETSLNKIVDRTAFLEAGQRLHFIDKDLSAAEAVVDEKTQAHLAASVRLKRLKDRQQAELERTLYIIGGILLFATMLWYLVIFVLEGSSWYWALAGALALSITVYVQWQEFQTSEGKAKARLKKAEAQVKEDKAEIAAAEAVLQDFLLEKEYCQRKVANYRVRE